jgi:5-methylcytosine-specific restriction endonuclease McrA
MADDARLSTALPRHPKTVKLKRRLGEAGCWGLVCLFLWVADNRSDGDLSGLSSEDLEIAADWAGEPGLFVTTLEGVGFLDGSEGSHSIHDWQEHNPFAATRGRRVAAARQAAAVKWGIDPDPDATRSKRLAEARAKGRHSAGEWDALVQICGGICVRCKLDGPLVKDHILPIYKGGSDSIENIQPLCKSCNSSKGPESKDYRPIGWLERLQNACETPAHHTTTPHPTKPKQILENQAEEIYKHYPRKVGKPAAIKAIISAIAKVKGDYAFLEERTRAFAKSPAGNAGDFTPYPATWFNQERYNDDEREWQRSDDRRQPVPDVRARATVSCDECSDQFPVEHIGRHMTKNPVRQFCSEKCLNEYQERLVSA